ncbi:hypothetical protein GGX14DRAFT_600974 [Mycena pura]|uniref:Uncharacterized protein n=1 Tax=Mycena pura TaxID=153505 RepID=A0AAD6XX96_9AGAR|nr:hypothetical protein GGX14DRAFT_600974 [Mycena pura]
MPSSGVSHLGSFSRITIALQPGDQRFGIRTTAALPTPNKISAVVPVEPFACDEANEQDTTPSIYKSEFIIDGRLSISAMLQARLHWQSGTTTKSEKVVRIDSKYALSRISRRIGLQHDDDTEPEKMTLQEASNTVRVLQDLNSATHGNKLRKYLAIDAFGALTVGHRGRVATGMRGCMDGRGHWHAQALPHTVLDYGAQQKFATHLAVQDSGVTIQAESEHDWIQPGTVIAHQRLGRERECARRYACGYGVLDLSGPGTGVTVAGDVGPSHSNLAYVCARCCCGVRWSVSSVANTGCERCTDTDTQARSGSRSPLPLPLWYGYEIRDRHAVRAAALPLARVRHRHGGIDVYCGAGPSVSPASGKNGKGPLPHEEDPVYVIVRVGLGHTTPTSMTLRGPTRATATRSLAFASAASEPGRGCASSLDEGGVQLTESDRH